ncbi:transmembrane amino acid transporter protein-domain-containing protein [Kickxella alabastrina]|uniref:transmembrane amino acid transporter protein-domain-containing protein n=1 Tax=Kickxella alabastrina TaxID=61397 RepID=UPI002220C4FB|nr:transmembrane amino acid transporter protein-domain-containing protein [Kickxella alabastrina]KAI7833913.1 transmembrane amino acid transporter protein-domain-containing protein [Kickxella alabastrina]KAJ1939536.1 hypothetical protein GGF37_004360 [Kickxella alabastrina]
MSSKQGLSAPSEDSSSVNTHSKPSISSQAEDADPHQHSISRNGNWVGAVFNIMCISIGTGTMNLPSVVKRCGWFGIVLFVLMAVIGWYVGVLFRRCMYARPSRGRISSFALVAKEAYGKPGFWFATIITYWYCCGTVVSWIIVCGTQITKLLGYAGVSLDKKISMTIIALVMWVPFTLLKSLKEITVSSVFGVLTAMFTVIVLAVTALKHPYTESYHLPSFDSAPKHTFIIGAGIPSALASISFMYAGAVSFPHIEGNMKKPKQFGWMMFLANALVCGAYLLSAVPGYLAYGDQTLSPILNNLPNLPVVNAATILIILHVVCAAPVMLVAANLELELVFGVMQEKMGKLKEFLWRLFMRSLTIGILLAVSIAIPYFGEVIDLVSAISTTVVFFLVPVFCYVKLFGWNRIPRYELLLCFILAAVGAVACIWGLIDAVKSLKSAVQNNH